jgi:hypothetical protein
MNSLGNIWQSECYRLFFARLLSFAVCAAFLRTVFDWEPMLKLFTSKELPFENSPVRLLYDRMVLTHVKALRFAPTGFAGASGGPDMASVPCSENNMGEGGRMVRGRPLAVTRRYVTFHTSSNMELSEPVGLGGNDWMPPEDHFNPELHLCSRLLRRTRDRQDSFAATQTGADQQPLAELLNSADFWSSVWGPPHAAA